MSTTHVRRAAATAALLALSLTACTAARGPTPGVTDRESSVSNPYGLEGVYLPQPQTKPEFTLTDTSGRPFDFQAETAGSLTLLYFGYTSCPDICPAHMATIAAALDSMPTVRDRVKVVFVTTDPERDSPSVIRRWLDNFSSAFIGLTGTPEQLAAAQIAANVPVAQKESTGSGGYGVSHAAQVIAFTPDGLAHAVYPFGVRQATWANDLPILLKLGAPGGPWSAEQRGLVVSGAVMPAPARKDVAAVYLTVENAGRQDDALIGATTMAGPPVEMHVVKEEGSSVVMQPVDEMPVPAGGELRLEPGVRHLMVSGLTQRLRPGDTFVLRLRFRNGGIVPVAVPVISYADLPVSSDMGDAEMGDMDMGDMEHERT